MKNKILIIISDNVESSIRTISEDIVHYLSAKFDVDIMTVKKNNPQTVDNIKKLWGNLFSLDKYDIIHLQSAIPISLALIIRTMHPKVYLLATEHDFGWQYFKNTLPLFKSRLLQILLYFGRNVCDKKIYPSYSLLYEITKLKKTNDNFEVVNNGIKDPVTHQIDLDSKMNSKFKIVVSGNYYYSKGIDLVLSIVDKFKDYEFHFFGDVLNGLNETELKNIKKNKTSNIYFHGIKTRKIFLKFLLEEKCIVCIPSRSESFSLVLIEAMAASCPTVVSNIPVFSELTDDNCTSTFDIHDIQSLILSIILVSKKYNHMAINSREMYQNNYTSERMCANYYKLYKKILVGG